MRIKQALGLFSFNQLIGESIMPGGFQHARTQSQGDVTGKLFAYDVAATHSTRIAPGDVARISGTASADGKPQADTAASTQSVTGIITAIDLQLAGEALSNTGLAALTAGGFSVDVDPHALYEVDVSNGPLVVANVGLNADLVATAASLTGGLTISNMTINATGAATTQTLPFRIVALLEDDAGVLGNRALVRINNSTISDGAAGV